MLPLSTILYIRNPCGKLLGCNPVVQVNGRPLELVQPEGLQFKLQEPILLLGKDR